MARNEVPKSLKGDVPFNRVVQAAKTVQIMFRNNVSDFSQPTTDEETTHKRAAAAVEPSGKVIMVSALRQSLKEGIEPDRVLEAIHQGTEEGDKVELKKRRGETRP